MFPMFSRTALAVIAPCLLFTACTTIDSAAQKPAVTAVEASTDTAPIPDSDTKTFSQRKNTSNDIAVNGDLKSIVRRHAEANGVPFSLANAVVMVESRYRPSAMNAGNYGLMQIRLQTARGVGYQGDARGLLNPDTNARYAMKYLAQAHKAAGGDICRTIMKYQSGHRAVRMNGANRAYCGKVRTLMAQA